VVITGREQLTELAKVWERGGRHIAGSAATIALVAREPEDERRRDLLNYDLGQATANMMLARVWTMSGKPCRSAMRLPTCVIADASRCAPPLSEMRIP